MLLHCHCERPTGVWQSHLINKRLLRRFTPRNDALLNAFVLILRLEDATGDQKVQIVKKILNEYIDKIEHKFCVFQDGRLRIRD
jgi:hypothetical protein